MHNISVYIYIIYLQRERHTQHMRYERYAGPHFQLHEKIREILFLNKNCSTRSPNQICVKCIFINHLSTHYKYTQRKHARSNLDCAALNICTDKRYCGFIFFLHNSSNIRQNIIWSSSRCAATAAQIILLFEFIGTALILRECVSYRFNFILRVYVCVCVDTDWWYVYVYKRRQIKCLYKS